MSRRGQGSDERQKLRKGIGSSTERKNRKGEEE